ncbi:LexA family transcriptional regulator [Methylorubrum populi]|uniref:LexA family transcriptional regulator n=1 Tax=Methylorubrum populi TaxID=223967 RepID=UPI00114F9C9F|nr:LexA family transcriptional regulator [Methylorubrum populi]QDI83738.1 LexA family transcriptional regulator [Methylorubrum populi]
MGNTLRELRLERGWTHEEAAAAMGVSRGQFIKLERGERGLTERTIALAARAFAVLPSRVIGEGTSAVGERSTPAPTLPQPNAAIPDQTDAVDPSIFKGPRNVPVYGTGSGGSGGDFSFNGQLIDHAPRPPGIANRKDVYVVYLVGDSVAPAYEDGSPIYVDPHRRPAPRDYVVVELLGEREGEPGPAFVKRLVSRGGGKLRLEQHNPPEQLDPIDEADVVRVHRVIPWPELIGI